MTFARWLRARSDDELRELLAARPDLMRPVPSDMAALADRAAGAASVARALDGINRFELQVVEALLALPSPARLGEVAAALGGADLEPAVRAAVDRLRRLALVRDDDGDALRVVDGAHQVLTAPAGLGPPATVAFRAYPPDRLAALLADLGLVPDQTAEASSAPLPESGTSQQRAILADHLADPGVVDKLLDAAGEEAAAALRRLTWGPPTGRVGPTSDTARRAVRIDSAESPLERLLARGLLAAADDHTVVLPREVALRLRDGRIFETVHTDPPALDVRAREPDRVDRTAGGQAFAAVRAVEDLLEWWGTDPPGVLRNGGLGVRDLRAAARTLDVDVWVAALYVETAWAAGLLAASGVVDGEWVPTQGYDVWRARPDHQRWAALAGAWLDMTQVPGLVGERDERGRPLNALGPELNRVHGHQVRAQTLRVLADAPPGGAPEVGAVRARLDWERPRRAGPLPARMVAWALREAEVLGVTGLGALSAPGRAVLAGDVDAAAEAVESLLPDTVDHVLLQADLTAVAPGPLTQDLARELAVAAEVESTGGATVYRFTAASLRRALDAGRTADQLLELLERHSRTAVPQPLRYLVRDVARRHGRVRVGTASAYLRCDDPATLNELVADRRAASLQLHRLAPTVLVSRASRAVLLDGLRSLGYAPVAESPEGTVVVTRPDAKRTQSRRDRPGIVTTPPRPDAAVLDATVRALRAGDRAGGPADDAAQLPGSPPRTSAAAAVEALREAVAGGRRVWIGYVDTQGRASSRIVDPVRVEGGYLTAYDTTRASVHRFALHRITGVDEVGPAGP